GGRGGVWGGGAVGQDKVGVVGIGFGCQRGNSRRVTFRGSGHNLDLGGSGIARIPQAVQDPLEPIGHRRLRALIYKTDSGDFRLLLRTRRDRPRSCRSNKPNKVAPPHYRPPRLGQQIVATFTLAQEEGRCPLWVKSRHMQRNTPCPLYPRKRTCAVHSCMSALTNSGHGVLF